MGEDLFAELCMRKNGVSMIDAFDISQDGMCATKRPANLKQSKKWKPDCASTSSAAMHPLKLLNMKHAWRHQPSRPSKEAAGANFCGGVTK